MPQWNSDAGGHIGLAQDDLLGGHLDRLGSLAGPGHDGRAHDRGRPPGVALADPGQHLGRHPLRVAQERVVGDHVHRVAADRQVADEPVVAAPPLERRGQHAALGPRKPCPIVQRADPAGRRRMLAPAPDRGHAAIDERHVGTDVLRGLPRTGLGPQDELSVLERDTTKLANVTPPFPRIAYTDAVQILKDKQQEIEWGDDLGAPHETALAEDSDRPVFIINYPKQAKAFYMKENPADPRTVLCDDLLAPEGYGEIIGGSQREDDHDRLLSRIREQGLPEESYKWYLELRKYGTFPHSGFGLGHRARRAHHRAALGRRRRRVQDVG